MIFVILESEYNVIDSMYQKFLEKYPKDCRVFIGARGPDAAIEKKVSTPPMFFKNWLIICNNKVNVASLKKLNPSDNTIVLQVFTKSVYTDLKAAMSDNDNCMFIDNRKLKEHVVTDWIAKNLDCTQEDAIFLYKRVHGNLKDIVVNVQLLSAMKPVNKILIKQYVRKQNRVTLNDICPFMLGVANEHVTYRDIVSVLYSYRFASSWVIKMLSDTLQTYLTLFQEIGDGNLSLENYREFRSVQKGALGDLSEYQYKFIIEAYRSVSTEKLFYFILQLQSLPSGTTSLFKLLALLKLGGNNGRVI